ncbi:hypothetical protein Nepgr_001081 [Nepenthes gracilis]|uniref:Uncharacterized protein n=1 Tax=Nepenthes gracilis TaxID=150966 RepID=A0AAD3P7Y2_NEPGR|nr:hypothetical protein Nepgr_001081 [Nepenthes gracilis]
MEEDCSELEKIGCFPSNLVTWKEIELSESYLICGMYDEAATLASSVLIRLRDTELVNAGDYMILHGKIESAAMVLVQSSKESGRISKLLNEVEMCIGSVTRIPVQVVLTGACIQVSEGFTASSREFLEDFLMKWQFEEGKYYVAVGSDTHCTFAAGHDGHPVLGVDEYLEVAQFYAVTLLGMVLNDMDHAIFWVEKAQLPEDIRQDLLKRLLALFSVKATSSAEGVVKSKLEEHESCPHPVKEASLPQKSGLTLSSRCPSIAAKMRESFLNWSHKSGRVYEYFYWFRNITIKLGKAHLAFSNGKTFLACLIFLICYVLQKKQDAVMRAARRRTSLLKQAVVDLWRLAFSYQVNPLAAVQPLAALTPRNR